MTDNQAALLKEINNLVDLYYATWDGPLKLEERFEASTRRERISFGKSFKTYSYPYDPLGRKGVLHGVAEAVLGDRYEFMLVDMIGMDSQVVITGEKQ